MEPASTADPARPSHAPHSEESVIVLCFGGACEGVQVLVGEEVGGPQMPQCRPLLCQLRSTEDAAVIG